MLCCCCWNCSDSKLGQTQIQDFFFFQFLSLKRKREKKKTNKQQNKTKQKKKIGRSQDTGVPPLRCKNSDAKGSTAVASHVRAKNRLSTGCILRFPSAPNFLFITLLFTLCPSFSLPSVRLSLSLLQRIKKWRTGASAADCLPPPPNPNGWQRAHSPLNQGDQSRAYPLFYFS